ncbi:MAG: PAS domain-containing protein, partial [Romboutsia sp.]|nr:PAS domain-containing protein [Romboutsia sp.]
SRINQLNNNLITIDKIRQQDIQAKELANQKLEMILQLLPGGVIILDNSGVIMQSNPAASDIFGVTTLEGNSWVNVVKDFFKPEFQDGLEVSLKNNKIISISTNALPNKAGQIILLKDVTQSRLLQDNLNQQQRLSSLGKMMASVAHQVKTPLSSALLYAHHMNSKKVSIKKKQHYSLKIKDCLSSLNSLVDSMLIYVRGEVPQQQPTSVIDICDKLKKYIKNNLYNKTLKVVIYNNAGNKKINCNVDVFVSAIGALIDNAYQASTDNSVICVLIVKYKNKINFIVSDKGVGVDVKNHCHMFKPFYTTKATGTGLGLSFVQIVANSAGGNVWVKSSREAGTKIGISINEC